MHGGIKDASARLPGGLRGIHGGVGVAEHRFRIAVVGGRRDPETESDRDLAPTHAHRSAQFGEESVGEHFRRVAVFNGFNHHGEFIAAETRDGFAHAHGAGNPTRDDLQQFVPDGVSERVVDPLEPVEIEQDHGHVLMTAPTPFERMMQTIAKEDAIGEAGQLIVKRLLDELRLHALALGDVLDDAQQARLLAVVDDRDRQLAPDDMPVLVLVAPFQRKAFAHPGPQLAHHLTTGLEIFVRRERGGGNADQLVRFVAQQLLAGIVGLEDDAIEVQHLHRHAGVIEKGAKPRVAGVLRAL